jgi:transcriptional regulator with GAF, ATPase, and Fis domain
MKENTLYAENLGIRIKNMNNPIIYQSDSMKEVIEEAKNLSEYSVPVLITGETGTGKGVIAKAIHYLQENPENFTKINCGALVTTLAKSELFGHIKGAFTGAIKEKKGILSSDGTVFLDEIGNIDYEFQAALLGVIEDNEFRRVGDSNGAIQKVRARIITATNSPLEEEISKGNFRGDLYHRLNVCPIHILPLRERKEDIPLLTDFFLRKYNIGTGKRINLSEKAREELYSYDFPGNIRELENLIQRAAIRTKNGETYYSFKEINKKNKNQPSDIKIPSRSEEDSCLGKISLDEELEKLEKRRIKEALKKTGFSQIKASKILGISNRSLKYRIEAKYKDIQRLIKINKRYSL